LIASSIEVVRPQDRAWEQLGVKRPNPTLEQDVFNVLASHRTLAKQGIPIRTKNSPTSLFQMLTRLEDLCRYPDRPNQKVWWLLQRIGQQAASLFESFSVDVLRLAETVTILSDFPLGLTILPEDTAPLQCSIPVSYRPVTPLLGALEFELRAVPKVFLRSGFKILIAECLEPNDRLYYYAAQG
jgi:hypothetical protein